MKRYPPILVGSAAVVCIDPWGVGQAEYVAAMGVNLACLESSKARLKETGGR